MKTKVALIFLTIVENYVSSAIEEPQWVKDMLNIESTNGIQSLKAPIISPKEPQPSEVGARGRSMPDGIAKLPDKSEGDASAMISRQADDIQGRDLFQDNVPVALGVEDKAPRPIPSGNSQTGPRIGSAKTGTGGRVKGPHKGFPFSPVQRKNKVQYHKPAPVNPIVQVQTTNMLLSRNNQNQVILNAYKRLAEVNQKKVLMFHEDILQ